MGLDTYYCLIFYGLTLIHLIDSLSQVVQIMYVICDIYIYIYITYIIWTTWRHTCFESTHRLNLGRRKGRTHWTQIFIPSQTEHNLGHQWSTKMAFHGINQDKHFVYCHLMHALMSTCDPMSFKISSVFSSNPSKIVVIHEISCDCISLRFMINIFEFCMNYPSWKINL